MENTYNQEIDHLIGFAGSYVNTALKEAEKNGFEINVDIDFLDNKLDFICILIMKLF